MSSAEATTQKKRSKGAQALKDEEQRSMFFQEERDTFSKLTPREHVLARPEVYGMSATLNKCVFPSPSEDLVRKVMSTLPPTGRCGCLDAPLKKSLGNSSSSDVPPIECCCPSWSLKNAKVEVHTGVGKMFDEVLTNASDHTIKTNAAFIAVDIDPRSGEIAVFNTGRGIEVNRNTEEEQVVSMIFGELLAGSNFDDSKDRYTGGLNGMGAKITNIFSSSMSVVNSDGESVIKVSWEKSMSQKTEETVVSCGHLSRPKRVQLFESMGGPMLRRFVDKITKYNCGDGGKNGFTLVTFTPDVSLFNGLSLPLPVPLQQFLLTRVYHCAAFLSSLALKRPPVLVLNGRQVTVSTPGDFLRAHFPSSADFPSGLECFEDAKIYTHRTKNRCVTIAVSANPWKSHVSWCFTNGVYNRYGGTHEKWAKKQIIDAIQSRHREQLKSLGTPKRIKTVCQDTFIMAVFVMVNRPTFSCQAKDRLITDESQFSVGKLPPSLLRSIAGDPIVEEHISSMVSVKQKRIMSTTDGKKTSNVNVKDLTDAHLAGTKDSALCTLIVTEGHSAKSMIIAGLSVLPDRSRFGVLPLRGKLKNPYSSSAHSEKENAEFKAIKMAMGFKEKTVQSINDLRYGRIIIAADADPDGKHIVGLLLNFLNVKFPHFARLPGFVMDFRTPLIRLTRKNTSSASGVLDFYSEREFRVWCDQNPTQLSRYVTKYHKGLGSSSSAEARSYFEDLPRYLYQLAWRDDSDHEALNVCFRKDKTSAEARRRFYEQYYRSDGVVDASNNMVLWKEFCRLEMQQTCYIMIRRAIPDMYDGLNNVGRKIIYFLMNLPISTGHKKVADLAGEISSSMGYHHGEASMFSSITNLAQYYVGSNNCPMLEAAGQFGTRLQGGRDAASARYISTSPTQLMRSLFPLSDLGIMEQQEEEGKKIEPEHLLPVLPLQLLNGSTGIATGWSTTILPYNPVDLADHLRSLILKSREFPDSPEQWRCNRDTPLVPFALGFAGSILMDPSNSKRVHVTGVLEDHGDYIDILELPVWGSGGNAKYCATSDYEGFLKSIDESSIDSSQPSLSSSPGFTISSFINMSTETSVFFRVSLTPSQKAKALQNHDDDLHRAFQLTSTLSLDNVHLLDGHRPRRFDDPLDVLESFARWRMPFYFVRYRLLDEQLEKDFLLAREKESYARGIREKVIRFGEMREYDFLRDLVKAHGFGKERLPTGDHEQGRTEDECLQMWRNALSHLQGMQGWWWQQSEKFGQLVKDRKKSETQLLQHRNLTPQDLWLADLDGFMRAWREHKSRLEGELQESVAMSKAAMISASNPQTQPAKKRAPRAGAKSRAKRTVVDRSDAFPDDLEPPSKKIFFPFDL